MHHGGPVILALVFLGVSGLLLAGALGRAGLTRRVRAGFRAGLANAGKDPSRRRGGSTARHGQQAPAAPRAERAEAPGVIAEWLRYRHFKGAARIADRLDRRRHDRYMARQAAGAAGSAVSATAPRSPAGRFGTVRGKVVRTGTAPPAGEPSRPARPPAPQGPPSAAPPPAPPAPGTPPPRGPGTPAPATAAAASTAPARQAARTDQAPAPHPGQIPSPAGGALMSAGAVEQVVDGVHGIYQRAMNGGIRAKHAAIKACAEACVRFALMLEMLSRGFADEKHYGPEITEPIAGAAMHLRAAAMSLGDADSAIATMLSMSVGELADSPRQAPVHTELSETGAH